MNRLIDIDKELKSLKTEYKPDESLRRQTRSLVKREIERNKGHRTTFKKAAFVLSPAAAFVLVLVLCISVFTAAPAKAAGYYTIDINPSISISVDENDVVISVDPENEDAARLLEGIDLKGMQFEQAFRTILQAAQEMDFIKDNGHILVAHFGEGQGMTQDELVSLVSGELPDAKINALLISGSADDYKVAEKSGKKAGIELLMKSAAEEGIDGQDTDAVINIMSDKAVKDNKDKGDKGKQDNNGSQNNANNGSSPTDNSGNNASGNGNHGNGNSGNGKNNNAGSDNGNKDKDKDNGNTKDDNSKDKND